MLSASNMNLHNRRRHERVGIHVRNTRGTQRRIFTHSHQKEIVHIALAVSHQKAHQNTFHQSFRHLRSLKHTQVHCHPGRPTASSCCDRPITMDEQFGYQDLGWSPPFTITSSAEDSRQNEYSQTWAGPQPLDASNLSAQVTGQSHESFSTSYEPLRHRPPPLLLDYKLDPTIARPVDSAFDTSPSLGFHDNPGLFTSTSDAMLHVPHAFTLSPEWMTPYV